MAIVACPKCGQFRVRFEIRKSAYAYAYDLKQVYCKRCGPLPDRQISLRDVLAGDTEVIDNPAQFDWV